MPLFAEAFLRGQAFQVQNKENKIKTSLKDSVFEWGVSFRAWSPAYSVKPGVAPLNITAVQNPLLVVICTRQAVLTDQTRTNLPSPLQSSTQTSVEALGNYTEVERFPGKRKALDIKITLTLVSHLIPLPDQSATTTTNHAFKICYH